MSETLNIAVAPAGPKTATAIIRSLFQQAEQKNISINVKAFYRNLAKAPEEFTSKPNFQAVKGDIADRSTLDFSGIDSVVTITPPDFSSSDIVKEAERLSVNVSDAVEAAGGVKKLVLLSSVAAHLDYGVGEIKTNNAAERMFKNTKVPLKVFIRCAYFMENWTMFPDGLTAPSPFFYSTVTPLDYRFPMIAVSDIGTTLAREALDVSAASTGNSKAQPHIYELQGPEEYTPLEVKEVLSKVLGKEVEIRGVEQKDLDGFFAQIFPPDKCGEWVEMAKCFLPGGVAIENPPAEAESAVVRGQVKLEEAIAASVAGSV